MRGNYRVRYSAIACRALVASFEQPTSKKVRIKSKTLASLSKRKEWRIVATPKNPDVSLATQLRTSGFLATVSAGPLVRATLPAFDRVQEQFQQEPLLPFETRLGTPNIKRRLGHEKIRQKCFFVVERFAVHG
jgi:hypothetical protein